MVNARKKDYLAKSTKKLEKAHIAAKIVEEIRSMDPAGRFLKEDSGTGLWWDIGDQKAIKKSGQALREDAPDLRHEIDGEDEPDSGDNDETKTPSKKEEGTAGKEPKQAEEAAAPKSAAPSPTAKKVHVPKSASAISSARANVTTPVISNNSRGSESPSPQELPPAGFPPPNTTSHQGMPAPQVMLMTETGVGMTYAEYMQLFQAQQQQLGVPGQQYMVIPFPQAQANTAAAVASNTNDARNSSGMYVPTQLFQGVKSFGQKATNYSEKASEMMQGPQPHPFASGVPSAGAGDNLMMMSRRPPSNLAFGRTFHPPTELSAGSTMSTISGLSSVMGPEGSLLSLSSQRSLGLGGGTVLSGLEYVDQQHHSQVMARANNFRAVQIMQDQRRMSQISEVRGAGGSDLTFSLRSLGSMSRSFSFPDLSNSIREEMRMFDESFANNNLQGDMSVATMTMAPSVAPSRNSPRSNEDPSELADIQASSSGDQTARSERPPTASNRSVSTASAMSLSVASISLASGASRGSFNVSDASFSRFALPDDGNRSIFSDLSNDILALDLAGSRR
jgi:hypothetical protein